MPSSLGNCKYSIHEEDIYNIHIHMCNKYGGNKNKKYKNCSNSIEVEDNAVCIRKGRTGR